MSLRGNIEDGIALLARAAPQGKASGLPGGVCNVYSSSLITMGDMPLTRGNACSSGQNTCTYSTGIISPSLSLSLSLLSRSPHTELQPVAWHKATVGVMQRGGSKKGQRERERTLERGGPGDWS